MATAVTSTQAAGSTGSTASNASSANSNSSANTRTDSGSSANAALTTNNSTGTAPTNTTGNQSTKLGQVGNFDNAGSLDVVRSYPWTLSKLNTTQLNDIPEIILYEHRTDEPAIQRQVRFYASGAGEIVTSSAMSIISTVLSNLVLPNGAFLGGVLKDIAGSGNSATTSSGEAKNLLSVYEEIFPDAPTGNIYYFPYFTKSYMELNSPQWEQLDDIGSSIDNILQGTQDILAGGLGAKGFARGVELARSGAKLTKEAAMLGLKANYPVVGIFDRPRIFASHNEREVTIDFPLYNTITPNAWKANRNLIYLMMSQYLYLKNSFITGFPPVWYRVLVPGQYFSFASCVTNFSVTNLGNIRKMYGYHVPDAWQVSITLKEMVMPSKNQFFAMTSGEAASKINISMSSGLAPGAR